MYELEIQERYADYDTQSLVNHKKICEYVETTYVHFILKKMKPDWTIDKFPLVLRKDITEYFIPIESKSTVVCKLKVISIGTTSFTLKVDLFDKDTNDLFASAERVMVYVHFYTKRKCPLESDFVEKLKTYI